VREMDEREKFCERVEELRLEEAEGKALGPDDLRFIETHVGQCSGCRLEDRVLDEMVFDGSAGPAPELDELACRRWVDSVLERTEKLDRASRDGWKLGRKAAIAMAASVVLAFGLGVALVATLMDETEEGAPGVERTVASVASGRLMMAAGSVERNGDSLKLGQEIVPGDRISVSDGGAVVSLGEGIESYLGPDTVIVVERMNRDLVEVRVESGRLLSRVDPGHRSPDLNVATERGKVFVTGTVFAVEAGEDAHSVTVFRGSVRLEEGGAAVRKVRVGERALFGGEGVERYDGEREEDVSRVLALLDLLKAGDGAAMEVESVPTGAEVRIDGAVLGKTPVMACLREGHRRLELNMDGFESVRELVELGHGARMHRVFELGQLIAADDTPDQAQAEERQVSRESTSGKAATPAQLLKRAQRLRMERDWRGAVGAYRELCRVYPSSAEARSALVSKGSIHLDKLGKPGAALSAFDRYLAVSRTGSLAQEASFGRARALRALGRTDQEKAALEAFVREFPRAIQIRRVKARLDQLQ